MSNIYAEDDQCTQETSK